MTRTLQGRIGYMAMVTVMMLPCSAAEPAKTARSNAEHALMLGRIDEAVKILDQVITANRQDGAAHLLLCRAFYAQDFTDQAVGECEAALANGLNNDSRAQDWMGRAYGKKADASGPFTGLKLARRVKDAFEAAVALDPKSVDAVDDLGAYYVQAPGIVGGGLDRARALADRANGPLPERAQRLRGLIAEKQKDYATAERELRAVAEGSANRPDGWLDLAAYYLRDKDIPHYRPALQAQDQEKALAAVRKGIAVNTKRDPSLYLAATILNQMHREPKLAEQALRSYLGGNAMDDDAPAFKAHYLLGQLLAGDGDRAAAKSEYEAALMLASNYAPARKALQAQ
jgi:tetratricopeptide (TPR) repeat protein